MPNSKKSKKVKLNDMRSTFSMDSESSTIVIIEKCTKFKWRIYSDIIQVLAGNLSMNAGKVL